MPKASERATALAKEVLAKIAGYDPYFPNPNPAMLTSWAEHISLKNPERDDMLDAVAKFYETNIDVKPLPASITSLARTIRQDRVMRKAYAPPPDKSEDPEPPPPPGAKRISMAEWEELHGQKFPKLALGKDLPDDNPLRVPCPHCRVTAGNPCTIPGTQQILQKRRAHDSRIKLAKQ